MLKLFIDHYKNELWKKILAHDVNRDSSDVCRTECLKKGVKTSQRDISCFDQSESVNCPRYLLIENNFYLRDNMFRPRVFLFYWHWKMPQAKNAVHGGPARGKVWSIVRPACASFNSLRLQSGCLKKGLWYLKWLIVSLLNTNGSFFFKSVSPCFHFCFALLRKFKLFECFFILIDSLEIFKS